MKNDDYEQSDVKYNVCGKMGICETKKGMKVDF